MSLEQARVVVLGVQLIELGAEAQLLFPGDVHLYLQSPDLVSQGLQIDEQVLRFAPRGDEPIAQAAIMPAGYLRSQWPAAPARGSASRSWC